MKNKKGKKGTKVGHVKPTNMGLEGFVDWVNLSIGKTQGNGYVPKIASEPAEESEHDMSSLAVGFTTRLYN